MVETLRQTLGLTCVLIGIWSSITALEWLVSRRTLAMGGAMGWDLLGLRAGWFYRSALVTRLFETNAMTGVSLVRLVAGLALLLPLPPAAALAALAVTAACCAILAIRLRASDGADKMGVVATGAAMLVALGLVLGDPWLSFAGLLWGGGQLAIAYCASGLTKLALPVWRSGRAMADSMAAYHFGHRHAHAVARHRGAALALSWGLMLAETLFPLALLAPPELLLGVLALFALFHLGMAVIMGLNTYIWAFAAAYPAAFALSGVLRHAIGLAP